MAIKCKRLIYILKNNKMCEIEQFFDLIMMSSTKILQRILYLDSVGESQYKRID